ncbi:MAG: M28 family peptidase [bacterium]
MSRLPFVLVAAALAVGCKSAAPIVVTSSPRAHAPTPTTGAITPADLMTRLYIFADDSMLGRESGQLGNVRGTNYIAAEMRKMGLQPGGENGTYFQTVPVVVATIDPKSRFAVDGTSLALWKDVAPLLGGITTRPLTGQVATVFGGQIGGPLITPDQAAGKLVVLLPASRRPGSLGRLPYSGDATTVRAQAQSVAALSPRAQGIAYVMLDSMSAERREFLREPRQEIAYPPEPNAGASAQLLYVSNAAAIRLFGGAALESLASGAAGHMLDANLASSRVPTPFPARNVIGILTGSDPSLRGQYVAIGAHNDHVGLAPHPLDHDSVLANNMVIRRQGVQDAERKPTSDEAARIALLRDSLTRAHGGARPDSVFNGADDDGSGTVAMLEIAERFVTAPEHPRRSLLFVSHTGEEEGLWGSQWFTDHPTVSRDSIVAQLNMDMVGRGKVSDIMGRGPNNIQLIGPRRLASQLGAVIDSVNAARTPHMDIDTSFDTNGHPLNRYCRSDHYMYARYNIPITYFSLGYHTDYHQVTDEPQYIDYDHLARTASFVHDIAEAVANRTQRLVVDGPRMDPQGGCRQ